MDGVKKWLWLRKRVICAALLTTAAIMLLLLSIDPTTRERERAAYIVLALAAFFVSIWLWLKQLEFVDEYVEEYEFLSFPKEKEEEKEGPRQPRERVVAQHVEPRPAAVKPWCAHCGSVNVLSRGKRVYCLDCGQITRVKAGGA
jgi:hypothetical protein